MTHINGSIGRKGSKMKALAAAAVLILGILTSCGGDPVPVEEDTAAAPDTAAIAVPEPPVEVETSSEPDTVVHTQPGTDMSFELEANPTTGYHWVLAGIEQDAEVVEQSGEAVYTPSPNPEGMVGTGGMEEWIFTALSTGEALIRLDYMPPGTDREPGTVWSAKVVVE